MEESKIFLTTDYAIRADLEQEIVSLCGLNIEANTAGGHKITGTEADLKRLGLSLSTRIYGVKCEIIND
jgi:hypothetical protein